MVERALPAGARALMLIGAFSCHSPVPDDTPPHETGTGDTDRADTAGEEILEPFLDGASWYRSTSVPGDQGLAWQLDETFFLVGHTVPSLLTLHEDAGYRLFTSALAQRGTIWAWSSTDGLDFTLGEAPVLTPEDFHGACGSVLLDVSPVYLPDGSYRLLVEGQNEIEQTMFICSAHSEDGDVWLPEEGYRYTGSDTDGGTTSVLGVLWVRDLAAWLVYYVGGRDSDDGNSIRIAISDDGWTFEPWVTHGVLEPGRVDPEPVRIEGGGLRLYHSLRLGGHPGAAESDDGVTFTDLGALEGLAGNAYHPGQTPEPGDICRYDPAFLRLPDDRLLLYIGSFETDMDGVTTAGIRRAEATDH